MSMSPFNYTLLVAGIAIVVGILLCLGLLSAFGQLHLGGRFHKRAETFDGKPLWDIDYRRLRDIYNLISKLTSTLKYQKVLETALDLGSRVLATPSISADRLVSAVLLFAETEYKQPALTVGAARHFAQSDMRAVLPGTGGLIAEVITEGLPIERKDPNKDSELSRIVSLHSCRVAFCLPLRAGFDTYGVLLF